MAYIPQSGSVVAFQSDPTKLVGTMSVVGVLPVQVQASVAAVIIGGSIATSSPANQSVSGTVGSSIIGTVPVTQATTEWTVKSSIAGGIFPISGSVAATITNFPTTQNVSGSVVAFQGGTQITSVSGQVTVVSSIAGGIFPISGSVAAVITNTTLNVSGSVAAWLHSSNASVITRSRDSSILAVPVGSTIAVLQAPSIVGTYAEDAGHTSGDKGLFILGVRNDNLSSLVSADLEYAPRTSDSAGRTLIKPFAASETEFTAVGSIVSTSVTLLAASVIGKKHYITDFFFANSGTGSPVISFRDGSTSILGYTIAPTLGGSNAPGLATPLRSSVVSQDLAFQPLTATSVLYYTVKGYIAP